MLLSWLRRLFLQARQQRLGVPVVVVGNISVGGTGKTPVIIALTQALQALSLKVGLVARGYGGSFTGDALLVSKQTDPTLCGDEPALLAHSLDCPIAIGRDRVEAGKILVGQGCQVILSDDGLQHYRLARDLEIILIDQSRGLGNGWCLPLGPLREPVGRLKNADWVLYNGGTSQTGFSLVPQRFRNLANNLPFPLTPRPWGEATCVDALAGIGNPERFFATLEALGLAVTRHPKPDHHSFSLQDFAFSQGGPLLITAKDAVKCRMLAPPNTWVLDVEAQLPAAFLQAFCDRILALCQPH